MAERRRRRRRSDVSSEDDEEDNIWSGVSFQTIPVKINKAPFIIMARTIYYISGISKGGCSFHLLICFVSL